LEIPHSFKNDLFCLIAKILSLPIHFHELQHHFILSLYQNFSLVVMVSFLLDFEHVFYSKNFYFVLNLSLILMFLRTPFSFLLLLLVLTLFLPFTNTIHHQASYSLLNLHWRNRYHFLYCFQVFYPDYFLVNVHLI